MQRSMFPYLKIVVLIVLAVSHHGLAKSPLPMTTISSTEEKAQPARLPNYFAKIFYGYLEDRPVVLELQSYGKNLSGSIKAGPYNYFSYNYQQFISLEGNLTAENSFTVAEIVYNRDAQRTVLGTLKGRFFQQQHGNTDILIMEGSWQRAGSPTTALFSFREQLFELDNEQVLISKDNSYQITDSQISVNLHLPLLQGKLTPQAREFNRIVAQAAQAAVQNFKSDLIKVTNEIRKDRTDKANSAQPDSAESRFSTIDIFQRPTFVSNSLISILFTVTRYPAGAAHNNSEKYVINFDLKTGRRLLTADLFKPGAKYLTRLSDYAIAELSQPQRLGIYLWEAGARPRASNYKSCSLYANGLVVVFDEEQVASFAANYQEVLIPYGKLKGILSPILQRLDFAAHLISERR